MSETTKAPAYPEDSVAQIMSHLETLDQDAKLQALLDLEKAAAGSPMIDRPLWLRGVPMEAIQEVRYKIMNAVTRGSENEAGEIN